MDFKNNTPTKRLLRPFSKGKKTKRRSLDLVTQHTLTRSDFGPKEKPITSLPNDIGFFYTEGE
jgi:hypothetical protein